MRKRAFIQATIASILYGIYLFPLRERAIMLVFQVRDLARAQDILNGRPIFFGPELTGGGHLPGAFYYYLLALPLSFSLGWKGSWLLLVLCHSISVGALWFFFRTRFGLLTAVFAISAYGTAYPVLFGSLQLINS